MGNIQPSMNIFSHLLSHPNPTVQISYFVYYCNITDCYTTCTVCRSNRSKLTVKATVRRLRLLMFFYYYCYAAVCYLVESRVMKPLLNYLITAQTHNYGLHVTVTVPHNRHSPLIGWLSAEVGFVLARAPTLAPQDLSHEWTVGGTRNEWPVFKGMMMSYDKTTEDCAHV